MRLRPLGTTLWKVEWLYRTTGTMKPLIIQRPWTRIIIHRPCNSIWTVVKSLYELNRLGGSGKREKVMYNYGDEIN